MSLRMEKNGLPEMAVNLQVALFTIWFVTGAVEKMEDFVLELWHGGIFVLDDAIFVPAHHMKERDLSRLRRLLLVYSPGRQGIIVPNLESMPKEAVRFTTFLGDLPGARPWIREWTSECEDVLRRAEEEIGVEGVKLILRCSDAGVSWRDEGR